MGLAFQHFSVYEEFVPSVPSCGKTDSCSSVKILFFCANFFPAARSEVAQISNLRYRRIAFGGAPGEATSSDPAAGQRITNPQYGRIQFCAISVAAAPRQVFFRRFRWQKSG
jgi:hypothetical protein